MAQSRPNAASIEVRVETLSQLFNTLDPFPFSERDLDKDAEEYIVGWAQELPRDQLIRILVHLPAIELIKHDPDALAQAINRYFHYRAEVTARELNELFRFGRMALVIGMSVLALCLTAARFALRLFGEMPFGRFVQESLIIFGWVANWKPIEIVLYDWWPIVRRRNLYRRLAHATVELMPYAVPARKAG
jgi:hypothetical protein